MQRPLWPSHHCSFDAFMNFPITAAGLWVNSRSPGMGDRASRQVWVLTQEGEDLAACSPHRCFAQSLKAGGKAAPGRAAVISEGGRVLCG